MATGPTAQRTAIDWRREFLASVVVFLVALPLCIGIAVAVGVSPGPALITGIVGGIIVGALSGSPLQVSGPAAGLFVIVADLIRVYRERFMEAQPQLASLTAEARTVLEHEATRYALLALGLATLLAGLLQLVAGKLRLGQWFRAVSPAVIKGMLAGIGALIVVSQFHVMLDHKPTYKGDAAHGGLEMAAGIPEAIWKCFAPEEGHTHHLAAITGILTISIILLWQQFAPRRLRLIPGALIAVLAATVFAVSANLPLIRLEVSGNILRDIVLPDDQWLQLLVDPTVLRSAVVIGIVASAETLLCATAVDQMHRGVRTNYDRELMAQGVGNSVCGLLGALPLTGVIVRSSANVHAGAASRYSTMMHGLWLLIFVVLLPWVLEYIPKSALGAILVYTGFKLINIKDLKKLWAYGKGEVLIYLITTTVIVVEDLLLGVVIGVALSAAKLLYIFSHLATDVEFSEDRKRAVLRLEGAATFIRLPVLAGALDRVPSDTELHVDFEHLRYIDHACLELLMDRAQQMNNSGGKLILDWDSLHAKFQFATGTNGNGKNGSSKDPMAA